MTPRCRSALVMAIALVLPLATRAQPPRDAEPPAVPRGILDPALPVVPLDAALEELRRRREAAPALERYEAGDYREAARRGLEVLAVDPGLHALRLAVANSLAWTGRYEPAVEEYRALLGTRYDSAARMGIANVRRWSGQADVAEPLYREVLEREPTNEDAQRGLTATARELRPALGVRVARTEDNQDLKRDEVWLTYRRWSEDRAWRLQVAALREQYASPLKNFTERALEGSIWALRLPLSPRLEASIYDSDGFFAVHLQPVRDRLQIRVGRVNWARMAFNAAADGLTANTLGIFGEAYAGIGSLRVRVEGFDISDGNRILDGEAQLTPTWQPLGWGLEWFGGVYGRDAQREDPRYWSPRPAYGLAFVGLRRGWHSERSDVTASLRAGLGFTETAKRSWGPALTGRYWLSNDIAIGLEAWMVDSPRPAAYRMHQVAAFVQHLW